MNSRVRRGMFIVALMGICAAISHAQQTRADELIPRSALLGPTEKISVQLSPDGSRVGYIAATQPGRPLMIAPIASGQHGDPRVVRVNLGSILRIWRWTYDPDLVLLVSRNSRGQRLLVHDLQTGGDVGARRRGQRSDRHRSSQPGAAPGGRSLATFGIE